MRGLSGAWRRAGNSRALPYELGDLKDNSTPVIRETQARHRRSCRHTKLKAVCDDNTNGTNAYGQCESMGYGVDVGIVRYPNDDTAPRVTEGAAVHTMHHGTTKSKRYLTLRCHPLFWEPSVRTRTSPHHYASVLLNIYPYLRYAGYYEDGIWFTDGLNLRTGTRPNRRQNGQAEQQLPKRRP